MAKYLELSAKASISSSSQIENGSQGIKKVKPYYENGKMVGYLIRSPKTKRKVLIGLKAGFNGDYASPTFGKGISIKEQDGYPEEHFGVILGQVIYMEKQENGDIEIIGQMPMIDYDESE